MERGPNIEHILDYPTSNLQPWELAHRRRLTAEEIEENPVASRCYAFKEDSNNFPTPENRLHFIMTMANDCLLKKERKLFKQGFELFQSSLSSIRDESHEALNKNRTEKLILKGFENNKPQIKIFLDFLKEFSILHFETSENYMKNYLNYEFMPGRYNGKVQV